ncbi:MAG: EAL domain-containing protein [Actinomycetota bacterium]|nr:EAL domain-containing protein [Actinomycetota bacterium]
MQSEKLTAERPTPRIARVALGALVLLTVVYVVSLVPGVRTPGSVLPWLDVWVRNGLWFVAVIPVALRAVLVREERAAWAALAGALAFFAAGMLWYFGVLVHKPVIPYPSAADAMWLCFYPLTYAAVVLLLRARMRQFYASLWLDGVLSGLTVAAVAAALLLGDLMHVADGSLLLVATSLAYPIGDLLLLTLVIVVFGLCGWRPGRTFWLLGVGLVVQAVSDAVYLQQVTAGNYVPGGPLDAGWAIAVLLLALSAWQRQPCREARSDGLAVLLPPAVFALLSVLVLLYGSFRAVPVVATLLALAALLVAGVRTALTFRDVRSLAESRHQARTDDLTGLANRRLFGEQLDAALAGAERGPEPLSVLLIDLDRFKEVNDSLGHAAGDRLLVEVGRRFSDRLRVSDALARLGGDEFAVLLPGTDLARAEVVAHSLVDALSEPFLIAGITLHVDASVGVAAFPEHAVTAEELLRRADVAMYSAKRQRAGVQRYQPQADEHSRERLELVETLRDGLETGQIVVHYQPKIEVATGRTVGVEALVRWQHPQRGLLYPDAFIPLAEHSGLMRRLTEVVLSVSLDQCAQWREQGLELTVAVNLSASSLLDAALPTYIAGLLADRDLPAAALEVEITESVLMADRVRSIEVLLALRELGVRIAVDDYGTGYSSLAYLRELPVHELKLDKSFVMHLDEDPLAAAIVRSTVGLSHSLGLGMVAEGVETAGALTELQIYGCDLAQGYHIGRPQPADQLTSQLQATQLQATQLRTRTAPSHTTPSATTR